MFRNEDNIKSSARPLLTTSVLLCLGLLVCGCATLYVQPAEVHGDSLSFVVAVDKPHTPNGIAIVGLPPKTIGINIKKEGKLIEAMNVNLYNGQYRHTFDNVEEDYEYIVEPRSSVAFEVGLGDGPYKLPNLPSSRTTDTSNYQKGYRRALECRNGEVRDFRIAIDLYHLSPAERNKFLMGFRGAYIKANDMARGEKNTEILKQSISGKVYEQALEIGKKHAKKEVTDEFVQSTIGRSLGLGGFELGWKAGYIDGSVQEEMSKKKDVDKENLYQEAETSYNLLKKAQK